MKTRKETSTNYMNEQKNMVCPVTFTLRMMGGRWKPLVLYQLTGKTKRYGDLRRAIPNITEKMLIETLKELEQDKLVVRKAYPVIPPHVEYSLSEYGKTLAPILKAMAKWGQGCQEGWKKAMA